MPDVCKTSFAWLFDFFFFWIDDDDDELMLNVLRCHLTYQGQVVTNAEARFSKTTYVKCMRV